MSTFRPFAHTKVRATLGALKFFPSLLFAIVAPGAALAQNTPVIWNGGNGNWFSNPSNWVCVVGGGSCSPPNGSGVTADIGTASGSGNISGTVTVNGPVNLSDGVALGNGAPGGLRVSSAANTLTAGTLDVGLSGSGTSTLSISGGGVVMDSFVAIGGSAGSSGSATVTGKGSQWNVSNQFFVGDNGQGTLSVLSGGKVTSNSAIIGDISGSSGQINVAGMGAQWIDSGAPTIGASGHGGLTISSGGTVSTAGGTIAANTGSSGSALVTGTGSQWNNSGGLGLNQNGKLTIANGGVVGNIGGIFDAGTVTVTGTGSTWNSGFVEIGTGKPGTLTIESGGLVNSFNGGGGGYISSFGGVGTVTVSGQGSQWNAPFIEVGTGTPGSLAVQSGAVVNGGGVSIGAFSGSDGSVLTVSGVGSQLITSNVTAGGAGKGTLALTSGAQGSSVGIAIGNNAGVIGAMTLSGAGTKWSDTSGNGALVAVGIQGQGSLTVKNQAQMTTSGGLSVGALYAGSSGTVIVSGSGSQLAATFADVGFTGSGTANVNSGGVVNIGPGSTDVDGGGSITASGVGSQWNSPAGVCVGCFSTGSLTASSGSKISSGPVDVGMNAGTSGTITITGSGTSWNSSSGPVLIGEVGTGILNVENGAAVSVSGDITVGDHGKGTMTISSGAHFGNANATLGNATGAIGNATVSGSGSQWNSSGGLLIGNGGQGVLNVINGGLATAGSLTNNSSLSIGSGSEVIVNGNLTNFSGTSLTGGTYNDSGILQFDGAHIVTNAANVTLNGAAAKITDQLGTNAFTNFTSNAGAGKLTLSGNQSLTTEGGSISNSGILTIGLGSSMTVGNGTTTSTPVNFRQVTGRTTVNGILASSSSTTTPTLHIIGGFLFGTGTLGYASVVNASGTIKPGDSLTTTGILAITGTYAQEATGILDVAVGGMTVGTQFDQLNVTGTTILNGTLNISLLSGFVPAIGDQFTILNASSVTGAFTTVNGTAIDGTEHFEVTVNANQLVLTVVAGAAQSQ